MKLLIPSILILFSLSTQAAIFGTDNREWVNSDSSYAKLGSGVAVAVLSGNFEINAQGNIDLLTDDADKFVCSREKFSFAPMLSYACTGFLVGPDLLLTAGHCAVNVGETRHEQEMYCKAFSWLFDYRSNGTEEAKNFPAENHFFCKEIIYAIQSEDPPYHDYAVIRLNRPATGRNIFPLAPTDELSSVDSYLMLGHPLGVPLVAAPEGKLLWNDPTRGSFVVSVDAFAGNSGSPVLNSKNEVVGILIAGTPATALLQKQDETCHYYNRCLEDGTGCEVYDNFKLPSFQAIGSEVQRIAPIREIIQNLPVN